ncbi:MAG: hypothetical protein RL695_1168 [Pseudomonadota bacterium]
MRDSALADPQVAGILLDIDSPGGEASGALDVTGWLSWFLNTLGRAIDSAQTTLDTVLVKARFWQRWAY